MQRLKVQGVYGGKGLLPVRGGVEKNRAGPSKMGTQSLALTWYMLCVGVS